MNEIKNGGPAFPIAEVRGPDGCGIMEGWNGMSLRDWFAGQALTGIAGPHGDGFSLSERDAANWAYQYADAMLKAREAKS